METTDIARGNGRDLHQVTAPSSARALTQPVPRVVLVDSPFSRNELQALRLRGSLREVLPGAYVSAEHPHSPATRARVAAAVAGEQFIPGRALCKCTAAWVYGCAPMPNELDILVPRYHRPCAPNSGMVLRLSEGIMDEDQICTIGGISVTSPLRTAMDISFNSDLIDSMPVLAAINAAPRLRCNYRQMLESIETQVRRPGRRRALLAMTRLMDRHISAVP
ncbi:type IV toxin-antitoxin system AbiEi family antitoxin [Paeniglutamicibacter antarcticus]|uniref:AbiEi antitoxin C-terminal domain-containing protein n=1 Tax=Paeniglutamicibacter antarcticus TaxID=494023 RepID=A0ABP9TMA6_9MICC